MGSTLSEAKEKFFNLLQTYNFLDNDVTVRVKSLTPEEAIGNPERRDFPIVAGKERVIEAEFQWARAQVFTDSPKEFSGKLKEAIGLPLISNGDRAIFIGVMNAVLKRLNTDLSTLHCRNNDPELCAKKISASIKEYGAKKIGLIGLNPAILESLSNAFGPSNITATDLNGKNIGSEKYGVEIRDGNSMTEKLVETSDMVLLTGTTFVNDTFDRIWKNIKRHNRNYLIYGVTCVGICELLGLNRICPYGRI